jgi:4-alpha-glucanotransferase
MSHNETSVDKRRAGILLHPTSLPGTGIFGSLGSDAFRFVEFLSSSGISVWQTLPLGPTHDDNSPYQCLSAHAGNPLLISLEPLLKRGWLYSIDEYDGQEDPLRYQQRYLQFAYQGFQVHASDYEFETHSRFCEDQAWWLDDYALYQALRDDNNHSCWADWPQALRDREPQAMEEARDRLSDTIDLIKFEQYLFFQQWRELKQYANDHGIKMFGDMPIFVAYDSADVWAQRHYFALDESGRPEVVAGVPPDYFSETGQRWGNPHYHWDTMQNDGFRWWHDRLRTQLEHFDLIRIDHFRGFEAYWEIPASAETAIDGHWVKAPGEALFNSIREKLGSLPLVAEDLGIITPEVDGLRRQFGLPGMKILQFAFDGDPNNPYLPHNHEEDFLVYTGTHDNDTTLGWFVDSPQHIKDRVLDYLGMPQDYMPWPLIRCAFASVACLAMIPMQDVLGLGGKYRMNTPGTTEGNWQWRFDWQQVPVELSANLNHLVHLYGRA